MATGMTVQCRSDRKRRQCTGENCGAQFGRPSRRRGCRICMTVRLLGAFFTPPSTRNRRSQYSAISMGFPQMFVDFQSISFDFLSFSISFSQLQSVLINFNQFQSVWLSQKRRNLLTTGRWGKQHVTVALSNCFQNILSRLVIVLQRVISW